MAKKFRILALALIFSGALNIVFLAAFVFLNLRDSQIISSLPGAKPEAKVLSTNSELFQAMSKQSFRELVSFLTNRQPVEEGFAKRDVALASLVAFHHFNIEKALGAAPAQVRDLQISETQKIHVFPGLSEDQFEAIIRYAYQEKWPLTAKGLLGLLQKAEGSSDESLKQAFFMTPEFYSLQTIFQRTDAPQERSALLKLVLEGNWEILESFSASHAHVIADPLDLRRELLLGYLALRSQAAAEMLLKTDFVFVLKRLEDKDILSLLALLKSPTAEGGRFCLELLQSPRSDAVRQAAGALLQAQGGKAPEAEPKVAVQQPPPAAPSRFHIVKEGESLWRISRQYQTTVDELIALNGLEKDALFPGMMLKVP